MKIKLSVVIPAVFLMITASLSSAAAHEKASAEKSAHWAAPEIEGKRPNPIPVTQTSISKGEELFLANCAGCHGSHADGRGPDASGGDPRPSNLRAMAGHHSDGDLAWKIKTGRGTMPGWKEVLSEDQIWDLVNFIQNLKNTGL